MDIISDKIWTKKTSSDDFNPQISSLYIYFIIKVSIVKPKKGIF